MGPKTGPEWGQPASAFNGGPRSWFLGRVPETDSWKQVLRGATVCLCRWVLQAPYVLPVARPMWEISITIVGGFQLFLDA